MVNLVPPRRFEVDGWLWHEATAEEVHRALGDMELQRRMRMINGVICVRDRPV